MKWNRGQIDISIVDETVAWHRYFIGCGDGIPNIRRLIVPNLNMITPARSRNCDGTIARQRLDGYPLFFDTVRAVHAEMRLSIHRHCFRKDRRPIDAPVGEDCARVAGDRKQDRRAMNPWKPDVLAELYLLLIIRTDNRLARNTETIREFRFAHALVGIFPRHRHSDSQLGANWRRTKVNLGLLDEVQRRMDTCFCYGYSAASPPLLRLLRKFFASRRHGSPTNTNHQMVFSSATDEKPETVAPCCRRPAFAGLRRDRRPVSPAL